MHDDRSTMSLPCVVYHISGLSENTCIAFTSTIEQFPVLSSLEPQVVLILS